MTLIVRDKFVIVIRHWMVLVFSYMGFSFRLSVAILLFFITYSFKGTFSPAFIEYIMLPMIIININYAFIHLMLHFVRYYHKIAVILEPEDKMILLSTSLFFQDDVQILELRKITKLEVDCDGFFPNVFDYGDLVIEQQNNDIRRLYRVPNPNRLLKIIREKTSYLKNANKNIDFSSLE
jgi:hypothetical protein